MFCRQFMMNDIECDERGNISKLLRDISSMNTLRTLIAIHFEYERSRPSTSSITLRFRSYRQTRINRITKLSSDACLMVDFRWNAAITVFAIFQRICGTLHRSTIWREFQFARAHCITKSTSVPNARGHFEAIERPELTEFAAALYVAFSTKSEDIQIPAYTSIQKIEPSILFNILSSKRKENRDIVIINISI